MAWNKLFFHLATDSCNNRSAWLYAHSNKSCPRNIQVDKHGRLWATGPGGVRVYDQEGHLLGLLHTGRKTGNVLLTPEPDNSVYITADDMLLRIKLRRGLV
eukprot:m.85896 g.85896  ORF g.85896 m.85896 type:complete len:101 (+) comp14441_c0_seq7:100-402(+)